jgi:phenylalanyl-tRNA synthetase alpha chain
MKTEPIYLLEPYTKEVETIILSVDKLENKPNEFKIILESTVFYPIGGGQPTDQGILHFEDSSEAEVYDVVLRDGEIWNYIRFNNSQNKNVEVGDKVKGILNWERRYKNMKIHSAGHVVDFAMYKLGFTPNKLSPFKGDHGKKPSLIYKIIDENVDLYNLKDKLQETSNELVDQNINFSWEFKSYEDLEATAIYLQPGLPSNKPLRALTLEGVGTVADGGTIVNSTKEVGPVNIDQVEKKEDELHIMYSVKEAENLISESSPTQNLESDKVELSDEMQAILNKVSSEIAGLESEEELTNLWRKYLGKDGEISLMMKDISKIAKEERKEFGSKVNNLKALIDKLISNAKREIKNKFAGDYLKLPLSELSFSKTKVGHLHPLTETENEINEIFKHLGYSVYDGPEIETYEFNFERCNVPKDHPALDLQDTIYIKEPNILLRTQTSSMEARALVDLKPPFKIVMPGRTYRNEKVNKSNHFTFHQYQLVCVQEKVSLAELIGTIDHLFSEYLGDDLPVRYRNKYYPEVEPGMGPDRMCFNCKGDGCAVCKHRGWREMGGAGIIHPNMIRMAGLDTNEWQGFAFGLGLDRWAMEKHNITDIRTLLGGNLAYRPFVRK